MYHPKCNILAALLIAAVIVPAASGTAVKVHAVSTISEVSQITEPNEPIVPKMVSVTAFDGEKEISLTEQGREFFISTGTILKFNPPLEENEDIRYEYSYRDEAIPAEFEDVGEKNTFVFKAVRKGLFHVRVARQEGETQTVAVFDIVVNDGEDISDDKGISLSDTVKMDMGTNKTFTLSDGKISHLISSDPSLMTGVKVSNNVAEIRTQNSGTAYLCVIDQEGIVRIVTVNIGDCILRTPKNDIVQLNNASFTPSPIPDQSVLSRTIRVSTGKEIVFSPYGDRNYTYQYYYQNSEGKNICMQKESTDGTFRIVPLEAKQYVISVIVRERSKNYVKKEAFTIIAKGNTQFPVQIPDTVANGKRESITFPDEIVTVWKSSSHTVYAKSGQKLTVRGVLEGMTKYVVMTSRGGIYEHNIEVTEKASEPFQLKEQNISLDVKETKNVTFVQKGNSDITYQSNNPAVAAVSENGVITGVKAGQTEIVVSSKMQTEKIQVTVNTTTIKLNTSTLEMFNNNQQKLTATLDPGSTTAVTFSSSNPKTASVSSGGTVTAVSGGTAVITAKTANGKTATCKVTVIEIPQNVTIKFASVCPTIHVGDTVYVDIKLSDEKYLKYVSIKASDNSKAFVSYNKNGRCMIKGLNTGKVYLTASLPNGKQIKTYFYSVGDYAKFRTMRAVEKGIDISCFNENIDYQKLKEHGYTFVIIRSGFGNELSQKDTLFEKHIQGAKKAGLGIGIYHFSYAVSAADARKEAQICSQIIAKYRDDIKYGVYIDYEEDSVRYARQRGYVVSGKVVTDIAVAFCEEIERLGYVGGIYSNYSYTTDYLDLGRTRKYFFWYAAPEASSPYYECDMWQYSFQVKDSSFRGDADGDKLFSTVFQALA